MSIFSVFADRDDQSDCDASEIESTKKIDQSNSIPVISVFSGLFRDD